MDSPIPQDLYDELFKLLEKFWAADKYPAKDRLRTWMVIVSGRLSPSQASILITDFAHQGAEHEEEVVEALCDILLSE
jgi:hypothetical protein